MFWYVVSPFRWNHHPGPRGRFWEWISYIRSYPDNTKKCLPFEVWVQKALLAVWPPSCDPAQPGRWFGAQLPHHICCSVFLAEIWNWTMYCWTMRATANWQISGCARRGSATGLPRPPSVARPTTLLRRWVCSLLKQLWESRFPSSPIGKARPSRRCSLWAVLKADTSRLLSGSLGEWWLKMSSVPPSTNSSPKEFCKLCSGFRVCSWMRTKCTLHLSHVIFFFVSTQSFDPGPVW